MFAARRRNPPRHPQDLLGNFLHTIATLIIVMLSCSQSICHVFADNLPNNQCGPNIVLILADDLGWADVAFHGGNAPTPHLDRLACEGVELAQHYVHPLCSPTRASLMTGRYGSRFGVTSPQAERALPWETVTLPRALKSVGYDTCLVGKWHLGSKPDWGPLKFGFDHSYGSLGGGVGPWNHRYKTGPYTYTWHRDGVPVDESGHVTDLIADEAVRWIESRGSAPFFLYVPFTAVHLPIKEPDEYLKRVPETVVGDVSRQYAACIMHLDAAVGRIIETLEKRGLRNDTLLVFTSDNGGSTSENNDDKYPADDYPEGAIPGNNRPLRGQKGQLYEGGIRVPTVISWPGKLRPRKVEAPVHVADWMPTLTTWAGYQRSGNLRWDGRDVRPLLEGANQPQLRTLYGAGADFRASYVRDGDWKLIVARGGKQSDELFDLRHDPYEKENVASREPRRVAELKAVLAREAASDNDSVVPKTAEPE